VPARQQGRQSAALARQGGQPRVLPRPGERRPGASLARRAPGLLATVGPCVTRTLIGATRWSRTRIRLLDGLSATRALPRPAPCSDWINRSLNRHRVTRGHRPDRASLPGFSPRHPRRLPRAWSPWSRPL